MFRHHFYSYAYFAFGKLILQILLDSISIARMYPEKLILVKYRCATVSCTIWPWLSFLFHLRKQHLSISIQWYYQSFHLSWSKDNNIDFSKNANIRNWNRNLVKIVELVQKWLSIIVFIKISYARLIFHNERKWLLIVSVVFRMVFSSSLRRISKNQKQLYEQG